MIFLNGKWMEESEATVSVLDQGFLFGDGIFDTMRLTSGKLEFFSSHLRRMAQQAGALGMSLPALNPEWYQELAIKNQATVGVWRVKTILTRDGLLLLTVKPYQTLSLEVRLISYPSPYASPTAKWKSLSYLDRITFFQFAEEKEVSDVLIRNPEVNILETSKANLLWVKDNQLFTPSRELDLLFGVTLVGLIKSVGMTVNEVKENNIPEEAHVYTINAMQHIRPVTQIDGVNYPCSEELEKTLQESLKSAIEIDHFSLQASPEQRYKALSSLAEASSREMPVTSSGVPK